MAPKHGEDETEERTEAETKNRTDEDRTKDKTKNRTEEDRTKDITKPRTTQTEPAPNPPSPVSNEMDHADANEKPSKGVLAKVSESVTRNLELCFENHGRRVASYPRVTLCLCLLTTLLAAPGLLWFHIEIRPLRLWMSQDSDFIKVFNWQTDNYAITFRSHKVIWEGENVLTAEAVREMWSLHSEIASIKDEKYGITWSETCAKIPSLMSDDGTLVFESRRKRSSNYDSDFSMLLDRTTYCGVLQDFPVVCLENSLLEIWGLEEQIIMNLTDKEVIDSVNNAKISKVFGFQTDFKSYLGGITFDKEDKIISATSAHHTWVTNINESAIENGMSAIDTGTGSVVDRMGLSFESQWVKTVLNFSKAESVIRAIPNAASSFGDISEGNIQGDIQWVILGSFIMLLFVYLTIGKRNLITGRVFLSMGGIFGIIQSVIICYGLCSYLGIFYTPVNSILPLLMIGLGVDDMFVIMSAWENVKSTEGHAKTIERLGSTMRHAGVAITVTSITDVVAFAVGATTVLPALRSFCIYAAVGILSVYFMQITFFVVLLIYDEKRIEASRVDLLPCIKINDAKPSKCSNFNITSLFFENIYCKYLLSKFGKCFIFIFSIILIGYTSWGTSQLSRKFDPMWFLPSDSYLHEWFMKENIYFPSKGKNAFIYFSNITLPEDMSNIQNVLDQLSSLPYIYATSSILTDFKDYYNHHPNYQNKNLTKETFSSSLSLFLHSESGGMFKNSFHFQEELSCDKPTPNFNLMRLNMILKNIDIPDDQLEATSQINSIINQANITGYRAVFSDAFIVWETNAIVGKELLTNMLLILVVVFFISLLLLASLWAAVLVFCCVLATLVNIGGLMWTSGLTIDTVSCIAIVLSVGLSVDYAVHIVHSFLTSNDKYSRNEKVKYSVKKVGPAVLHGGLSTLIAFLIMAPSTSHVFQTFFKIFSGSAIFGMYWGIFVLPAVLSIKPTVPNFFEIISRIKKNNILEIENRTGVENKSYISEPS